MIKKFTQEDNYYLIDDIKEEVMLFIVHQVIVLNKVKDFEYMMDGIDCYTIVLLMNYKMKYEPEHYREKFRTL